MIHTTAVISPEARIAPSAEVGPHVVIEDDVVIGEHVTIFAGAFIGKQPKVAGIVQNPPKKAGTVFIGAGCVIGANVVIYAGTTVLPSSLIGDGATIRENCHIGNQCIVGNNCTLQNNVWMGDRVRVVDLSHITAHVTIEDDVFWSVGVLSMNDNSMARGGELKPPYIRKGAMLGGGALLLPGVEIGEDATVGAGSVVTKDVAPGSRVMGIPARNKQEQKDMLLGEFYPDSLPPRPYDKWPPEDLG